MCPHVCLALRGPLYVHGFLPPGFVELLLGAVRPPPDWAPPACELLNVEWPQRPRCCFLYCGLEVESGAAPGPSV